MDANIVIGIACHKPFEMPDNELYLPISVGASLKESPIPGTQPDNEGDNISHLNPYYCELTAQYWLWKNVEADYYGLCHYRRFLSFCDTRFDNLTQDHRGHVLVPSLNAYSKKKYHLEDTKGMREIIESGDIIAPEQQDLRRVYTPRGEKNSVYDHFAAHDGDLINVRDLDKMIEIVHEKHPEFAPDLDEYLSGPYFRGFNCFVMKRELFFELCEYEFDVLAELEKHIDMSSYDITRSRVYGFMAEIISSAFIYHVEKTNRARVRNVQVLYFDSTDPIKPLEPWDNSIPVAIDAVGCQPYVIAPLVESLIERSNSNSRYDLLIVHTQEMTGGYKKGFQQMLSDLPNFRISFIDWNIEARALEDRCCAPNALSTATPCALPWILERYNRIVLFSWNVILHSEWEQLYEYDLGENLVGAAKDIFRVGGNNNMFRESFDFDRSFLGLSDPLAYISRFVMVLDLKRIRSNISLNDVTLVLGSFKRELECDEATNVMYEHNVAFLNQSLNCYSSSIESFKWVVADLPLELAEEYRVATRNPRIVTFDNTDPFWPCDEENILDFWRLARATPFYEHLIALLAQTHVNAGRKGREGEMSTQKVFNMIAPYGSLRREFIRKAIPWDSKTFNTIRNAAQAIMQ